MTKYAALAFVLISACGPNALSLQLVPNQHINSSTTFPSYSWCDDSEPYAKCEPNTACAPGFRCVDSWCQPIWLADCQPRCIPRAHPKVLCHGNFETHGVWPSADVKWMAVLEPAEHTQCDGPAWQVWGTQIDDRPRDSELDKAIRSTWHSETTFCTNTAPGTFEPTNYLSTNPDIKVYLLMWAGYAGTIGLVSPIE